MIVPTCLCDIVNFTMSNYPRVQLLGEVLATVGMKLAWNGG